MKKLVTKIFVSITALVALTLSSHAGPKTLESLLQAPDRPTMSELVDVVGLHPQKNPFQVDAMRSLMFSAARLSFNELPRIIAYMERAFPGATWAPLGRDAVLFGDLLDAFYLSLGQPGRVSRLNASGPSIESATPDELLLFLEAAGYSHERVATRKPFVIIDRTSFSLTSQSRLLVRSIYRDYYLAQGRNFADLYPYVGTIALSGGKKIRRAELTNRQIEKYFSWIEDKGPNKALRISIAGWTDNTPWHHSFGKLEEYRGRFQAIPGSPIGGDKNAVIGQMIWILQNVTSPEFKRAVTTRARRLGYEFPTTAAPEIRIKDRQARISERLQLAEEKSEKILTPYLTRVERVFSKLKIVELPSTTTNTGNAEILTNLIESIGAKIHKQGQSVNTLYQTAGLNQSLDSNSVYLRFIQLMGIALDEAKINEADYKRLFDIVLENYRFDESGLNDIQRFYEVDPTFARMLIKHPLFDVSDNYRRLVRYLNNPDACAEIFADEYPPFEDVL